MRKVKTKANKREKAKVKTKNKNRWKKRIALLLAVGTLLSPLSAFAEETGTGGATAEPTQETYTDVTQNGETSDGGDATNATDGDAVTDDGNKINGTVEIANDADSQPTVTITESDDTKYDADKADSTPDTPVEDDNKILDFADGNQDRVDLYKTIQKTLEAEIADNPHFKVLLTGHGTVEITDKDGTVSTYTRGYLEKKEDKDGKDLLSDDDKKQIEEEMGEKTPGSVFAIYGEEGDTFHIKAVPADEEQLLTANNFETKTTLMEGTNTDHVEEAYKDIEDQKEKEAKMVQPFEYDITLESHKADIETISFSEYTEQWVNKEMKQDGGSASSDKVQGLLKVANAAIKPQANVSKSLLASGGGSVSITGINTENPGMNHMAWNDTFKLNSATDSTLNNYLAIYRNTYGSAPTTHCYDAGICAPWDGSWTCSWSASSNADGTITVTVDLYTQADANSEYGYGYYGPTQRSKGSFTVPAPTHNFRVTMHKSSNHAVLVQAYPSDFSLKDATYTIYANSNGTNALASMTTDANGVASYTFSNIKYSVGNMYVKETAAPKGHKLNTEIMTLDSTRDSQDLYQTEETENTEISLSKLDTNGAFVPGAEITLHNKTTNEYYVITSASQASSLSVSPGQYEAYETKVPDGYYPAESISFEVKPNVKGQSFTMTDAPIEYNVIKVDKKTDEPVEGVKLQLLNEAGALLEEWTSTTEAHKLGTGNLQNGWSGKLVYGKKYQIHEDETVPGYEALLDNVTFTVSNTAPKDLKPVTVKVGNTGFDYRVDKLDADTNTSIKGAKMQLKDGTKVIDEWTTTGEPHQIEKKLLSLGKKYTLHEVSAPEGYYRNGNDVVFLVENTGGATQTVTMTDYKIKYQITKKDGTTSDVLSGVKLGVYEKDSNRKIVEFTTSANPYMIDYTKLQGGKTYYVKELETIKGYYLDTDVKEFSIPETMESNIYKKTITITFTDKPISVWAGKRDADNNFLAGAKMAILDNKGNQIYTFTSTADGRTKLPNSLFEVGQKYYLTELAPPDGYYYAFTDNGGDKIEFSIPKSWQEVEKKNLIVSGVSLDAKDYKINYTVTKLDDLGNNVKGVHLGLFDDSGKQIEDWTTDGKEHAFESKLIAGKTYTLKELTGVAGLYKVSSQAFTVEKVPTGKDLKTVIKGQSLNIKMVDDTIRWRITKQDKDGNVLKSVNGANFVFEVYDSNGTTSNPDDDTLISTLSTDDAKYQALGYWELSSELTAGTTYRVHEKECPNGYSKAEDVLYTVTSDPQKDKNGTTIIDTTVVKDDSYTVKFRKVDSNEKLLTSYSDPLKRTTSYFIFDVYDQADQSKVAFSFSTDDYKDGYVDISKNCIAGHIYKVVEREYPVGYYKAKDAYFTCPSNGTIEVKMTDPNIKARFRKLDDKGNVLTGNFKFNVINKATGDVMTMLDLSKADDQGYVYFGDNLSENTTYNIVEIEAENGYEIARGYVQFTTPAYYTGQNQVKNYCIIKNGDTTEACTTWAELNK